jgi:hypothetical protein
MWPFRPFYPYYKRKIYTCKGEKCALVTKKKEGEESPVDRAKKECPRAEIAGTISGDIGSLPSSGLYERTNGEYLQEDGTKEIFENAGSVRHRPRHNWHQSSALCG